MYKLRVTCSCGATLELEFDTSITITASSAYDKFLKAHENCRGYSSVTNVTNTDSQERQRLDELDMDV